MPNCLPTEPAERKLAGESHLGPDLRALTLTHELSRKIYGETGLEALLQEVMDVAVVIAGAEHGTLQLLEGDTLRIVAHHGHEQPFLDFFESAESRASVCGEATRRGERVLVPDVEQSPLFGGTDSLAVLRAAGVRAVQSTPILSRTGALRGMLETYQEFQRDSADIVIEDTLPHVMGNEAGLTQCFSNLLGNAVKFAHPGQKPSVKVRAELRDGWVRLWVEDKGIGISESMRPRVFDMFSRGSSAQAGTGIGLALVRKVVDRMGGRVGVESEPGRGSRFWVELRPGEVRPAPGVI